MNLCSILLGSQQRSSHHSVTSSRLPPTCGTDSSRIYQEHFLLVTLVALLNQATQMTRLVTSLCSILLGSHQRSSHHSVTSSCLPPTCGTNSLRIYQEHFPLVTLVALLNQATQMMRLVIHPPPRLNQLCLNKLGCLQTKC